MLTLTQRFAPDAAVVPALTLALTAEDRTRSRHYFETPEGQIYLRLPRGTVLRHGDLLRSEGPTEIWVRVIAKPEPVVTVTAASPLALLRAAYHLGNRHVPLEVAPDYLRFVPDPVLKTMLMQLNVQVTEAVLPFQPEAGAYGHHGYEHEHSDGSRGQHGKGQHSHENSCDYEHSNSYENGNNHEHRHSRE